MTGSRSHQAPSPSLSSLADMTDEEYSFSKTPESRSGADSPMTATSDADNIYCVEYAQQLVDRQAVKLRKTCHRCGNIRKTNISCNSCEQIFCKACSRKFEQCSQTGFKFDDCKDGCPVCLKLCCCANPKGYECKSMIHCYRRCEVSRKQSKRRAKANANTDKKVPYNYQNKRGGTPSVGAKATPVSGRHSMPPLAPIAVPPTGIMSIQGEFNGAYSPYYSAASTPIMGRFSEDKDFYNSSSYGDVATDMSGGGSSSPHDMMFSDVDQIKLEPDALACLDILAKVASTSLMMAT